MDRPPPVQTTGTTGDVSAGSLLTGSATDTPSVDSNVMPPLASSVISTNFSGIGEQEDMTSTFLKAIGDGNLVQIQSLVSKVDINVKGKDDGTALYWSARNGYVDVIKLLLTFNPDVNIQDVRTLIIVLFDLSILSP